MRRIKRARIGFISLVPKGANQLQPVYKEDGTFSLSTLVKEAANFDEKGELLAVVYAPEQRDSQGDIASAEVIQEMAHEAMRKGVEIDIRHNEAAVGRDRAYVAESFLIQKGDERFVDTKDYQGNPVDVTGAWAVVVKIDDPELRRLYKEEGWQGVSMGGRAELVPDDETKANEVAKTLAAKLNNQEHDMKPEELEAALAKSNEALAATLGDVIAKALKPVDKTAEEKEAERLAKEAADAKEQEDAKKAPIFKGDASKPEDVAAHAAALRVWKLQEAVDWNDADSVSKYQEELAKLNKSAESEATRRTNQGGAAPEQNDFEDIDKECRPDSKAVERMLDSIGQGKQA